MPQLYIEAKDLIAAIVLIGCFVARSLGHNSALDAVIIAVALSYGIIRYAPTIRPPRPPRQPPSG